MNTNTGTGKLTAAETAPGTVQNIAKAAERMSWSFMLRLRYVQLVVVKNYGIAERWRSYHSKMVSECVFGNEDACHVVVLGLLNRGRKICIQNMRKRQGYLYRWADLCFAYFPVGRLRLGHH